MRSVRCDVCGTKALMAASQCPKCGHLFEVRDGFGELLPLAYCSSCDSYYPESVGSCRWCGTKPEHAPIGPRVWRGVGVAALVVLTGVAWLMRDAGRKDTAVVRMTAQRTSGPPSVRADTAASRTAVAPADTAAPRVTIASAGSIDRDSARSPDTSSAVSTDPIVPRAAPRSVARPPLDQPSPTLSASVPSKSRTSSRWVNSISKNWVVVRSDASNGARIIASIGPHSRVQLGESRGTWRRIRARGIVGWVEPRSFFVAVQAPTKTRGLAAR